MKTLIKLLILCAIVALMGSCTSKSELAAEKTVSLKAKMIDSNITTVVLAKVNDNLKKGDTILAIPYGNQLRVIYNPVGPKRDLIQVYTVVIQ